MTQPVPEPEADGDTGAGYARIPPAAKEKAPPPASERGGVLLPGARPALRRTPGLGGSAGAPASDAAGAPDPGGAARFPNSDPCRPSRGGQAERRSLTRMLATFATSSNSGASSARRPGDATSSTWRKPAPALRRWLGGAGCPRRSHGADAGGRRGVLLLLRALPADIRGMRVPERLDGEVWVVECGRPCPANANCVERCPVVVRRGHGAAAGDRAQLLGALAGGDLPRRLLHLHWFGELSFAGGCITYFN